MCQLFNDMRNLVIFKICSKTRIQAWACINIVNTDWKVDAPRVKEDITRLVSRRFQTFCDSLGKQTIIFSESLFSHMRQIEMANQKVAHKISINLCHRLKSPKTLTLQMFGCQFSVRATQNSTSNLPPAAGPRARQRIPRVQDPLLM